MNNSIKTIKQQSKQLKDSKQALLSTIKFLQIDLIPPDQDLQNKHITIQKLFDFIPNQQRLSILQKASHQYENRQFVRYNGDYEIVKRAIQKKLQLKPQTKNVYYIFTELNMPKIVDQFKQFKQEHIQNDYKKEEGINQFKSFEIMQNKSLKVTKIQKNTINPILFSQNKQVQNTSILSQHQYLNQNDILLNISLYDSVYDQKMFQYVCLAQMKLNQLKNNFYCLISKLCEQSVQKLMNKKQIKQKTKDQNFQNCFFLIQENFYYHGNYKIQDEIDEIIQKIQSMSSQKYRKFPMAQTQLKSLRIIFGRPYLFRHLGGCDHTIVFKNLRLYEKNVSPKQYFYNDQEDKKKYPVTVYQSKLKQKKCQGCQVKYAKVVTFADSLKNGSISYLCKQCHLNCHNQKTNMNNKMKKSIPYIHD